MGLIRLLQVQIEIRCPNKDTLCVYEMYLELGRSKNKIRK